MSGNGLTEQEKSRCRGHMGYLDVAEAYTFVLGTPAAVETQYLLEGAMLRVRVAAMPRFRRLLAVLDAIEEQKAEDLDVLVARRVGSIDLADDEQKKLDAEYEKWRGKLANLLGCPVNPFDKSGGGDCVNVAVIHG